MFVLLVFMFVFEGSVSSDLETQASEEHNFVGASRGKGKNSLELLEIYKFVCGCVCL